MKTLIALTPAQIALVHMSVNHIIEFGEDVGQSGQSRSAELRVAHGIDQAIANPLNLSDLLSAARAAESFIRQFEAEWSTLTDDEHGEYRGAKIAIRLRAAIEEMTK